MKKLFLLFGLIFFAFSCSRTSDDDIQQNAYIDVATDIYVRDATGKNITASSVNILKVNYLGSAAPTNTPNFLVASDEKGEKFLRVFLNSGDASSDFAETQIEWSDGSKDIFKAEIAREKAYYKTVTKIFVNGTLVWEPSQGQISTLRMVTLQK